MNKNFHLESDIEELSKVKFSSVCMLSMYMKMCYTVIFPSKICDCDGLLFLSWKIGVLL